MKYHNAQSVLLPFWENDPSLWLLLFRPSYLPDWDKARQQAEATPHFFWYGHIFLFCAVFYFFSLCFCFLCCTTGTASERLWWGSSNETSVHLTLNIAIMMRIFIVILIVVIAFAGLILETIFSAIFQTLFCAAFIWNGIYNNMLKIRIRMCCEPVRTASGQTYWVVMEVTSWFLRMFDLLPKHQHQDEHRLLHRKSSALWGKKNAGWGKMRRWGGTAPFLGWHKMQALPCRTCGFKGRRSLPSSPFCFSALQNSWTEQRLSVLIWLPAWHRVLQTSTHLCF